MKAGWRVSGVQLLDGLGDQPAHGVGDALHYLCGHALARPYSEFERYPSRQVVARDEPRGSLAECRHQRHAGSCGDGGMYPGQLRCLGADGRSDAVGGQGLQRAGAQDTGVVEGD